MKPETIKKKKDKILEAIRSLEGKILVERAKLKALQGECLHGNIKKHYSFGESELVCPDCGMVS